MAYARQAWQKYSHFTFIFHWKFQRISWACRQTNYFQSILTNWMHVLFEFVWDFTRANANVESLEQHKIINFLSLWLDRSVCVCVCASNKCLSLLSFHLTIGREVLSQNICYSFLILFLCVRILFRGGERKK